MEGIDKIWGFIEAEGCFFERWVCKTSLNMPDGVLASISFSPIPFR
jgi:hypothetical protein